MPCKWASCAIKTARGGCGCMPPKVGHARLEAVAARWPGAGAGRPCTRRSVSADCTGTTETMMRAASLAGSLVVLLGGAALAAQGDALVVTGEVVNVRAGPGSNAPILRQVKRDDQAVELIRQGSWVQVRLPDGDAVGWIHGSLLATVVRRPAAEVAERAPGTQPPSPAPAAPGDAGGQAPPDQMAAVSDPATVVALAQFRKVVIQIERPRARGRRRRPVHRRQGCRRRCGPGHRDRRLDGGAGGRPTELHERLARSLVGRYRGWTASASAGRRPDR